MEQRSNWVWSTHPIEHHIDALDNAERVTWTCNERTRAGDLVLVYTTQPDRHIRYLLKVATDADKDWGDPQSPGEWDGSWFCDATRIERFDHPLTMDEMKADPLLASDFKALRGNFQMRSYRVHTGVVWSHLLSLLIAANPTTRESVRLAQSSGG